MLETLILILLWGLTAVILLPIIIVAVECLLAMLPLRRLEARKHHERKEDIPFSTTVLIPAHNEEAVIEKTLRQLQSHLPPHVTVLVVADNCTDSTAVLARRMGVTVLERFHEIQRGKAFALQAGLDFLADNPPDAVVVLDADCHVEFQTVTALIDQVRWTNRPAQAVNLSLRGDSISPRQALQELGIRFVNLVRPSGVLQFCGPCPLMGTGMAFPWKLLREHHQGNAELAEDKLLGIELAIAGHPALFSPEAKVTSLLPPNEKAFLSQRTRWEHGHLGIALKTIPRLVKEAVCQVRPGLLVMAADLAVPPLALLVMSWLAAVTVAGAACLMIPSALVPLVALFIGGGILTVSILAGWAKYCRESVPLTSLLFAPFYVLKKLPIYVSLLLGRKARTWVRTERAETESESSHPVSPPLQKSETSELLTTAHRS